MIGTEANFRSMFRPDRARVLLTALERSAERARELTVSERFGQPRTEPTVAFDLATTRLDDTFDALPGIDKAWSQGQILWIVDGTYAIRLKRLDMGYQAANHASMQQSRINGQLRLDGMPALIYVCAGVRYSVLTGLPIDYVIVKHYPGSTLDQIVEWVVDIRELAEGGGTMPVAPVMPFTPPSTGPEVTVRPRRARRLRPTADDLRDEPTAP